MECPFCYPSLNKTQVLLENESCLYLDTRDSVLIGSGMIIPKEHRETTFDLTQKEWQDTYKMLNQAKAMIDKKYKPDGYNIGWNCGRAGGQNVLHAHLHVIPRHEDELFSGQGIRYWLKQDINKRSKGMNNG